MIFKKKDLGMLKQTVPSPELEKPGKTSTINKINYALFAVLAVIFVVFHLYTAGYKELTGYQQRMFHLTLALMMCFLISPPVKHKGQKTKIGGGYSAIPSAILVGFSGFYLFFNYINIVQSLGRSTPMQIFCGVVIVISLIECTRRLIGLPLPLIATIAVFYALFGNKLPGMAGQSGVTFKRMISQLTMTTEGIFSQPLAASATVVVIFIIFASCLNGIGIGQYFVDLVMAKFGKSQGASAKSAVIGSCLMGMLSGSVIANVMGTGTFTIPMMKKNGYTPRVAGAVEAVSSTGGQIMPPVMGAAAYIIAEILAIPFMDVLKAAIIPALLYYFCEFWFVHYEAARLGLKGFNDEEIAEHAKRIRGKFYLMSPLVLLMALMLVNRAWTAQKCAFFAVILTIIIGFILKDKESRLNLKKIFSIIKEAASNCLECAMATACAGIIIGVFSITGVGIKLSASLISLSGGHLLVLLVLTGIVSIILGMGLTTTGCYIILATLVAPTLVTMGVPVLCAHFFVFFFGIYSAITPPVAVGSYAAASLSGDDPFRTGVTSFRIALPSFIIPFVFVYSPAMLLTGSLLDIILVVGAAVIGSYLMVLGTVGFYKTKIPTWQRGILLVAGMCLIWPSLITDFIGIVIGGYMILLQIRAGKKLGTPPTVQVS